MKKYEAIGVVELQYFTYAAGILDQMCKTANVEFLTSENYLGGRLVSLIIGGSISDVQLAIEAAKQSCQTKQVNPLKMALMIPSAHPEIMKYIISEDNQSDEQVIKDEPTIKRSTSRKKRQTSEAKIEETNSSS